MRSRTPLATATIAYAETYAALARRHRDRTLPAPGYARLGRRFEDDWATLLRVELDGAVLASTRVVIQRHVLRGFDGIHLASALRLRAETNENVTLAAADERLLQAAHAEGLAILNVETGLCTTGLGDRLP
jgi:uncharacterized protein